MNAIRKILVSFLVALLALVVYFMPKQYAPVTGMVTTHQNFDTYLIEESPINVPKNFGSLNIGEEQSHGYGYIGTRQEKATGFGKIEFKNGVSDSSMMKQLRLHYSSSNINTYQNAGIGYALIDGKQVYIDNSEVTAVNGFNGKIFLATVVNTSGHIDSVIYLSSLETPSYLHKIQKAGFFAQFGQLSIDEKHTIDAVSGATITSIAVAKAVSEIMLLAGPEILSDYLSGNTANFQVAAKLNKIWILNLALLIAVFVLPAFKRFRKKKILWPLSIFTVAWLGFYLNASFTWILFAKTFTTTGLSIFTIAYISLVLVASIWFKNTYCKYICPFGNAQRLVFKISPFKKRPVKLKNKQLRSIRYVTSIFVIAGYLAGFDLLSEYELFPYFFGVNPASVLFGVAVIMVLLSMRIPNLWCRALCPTGCVLDVMSDISNKKRLISTGNSI